MTSYWTFQRPLSFVQSLYRNARTGSCILFPGCPGLSEILCEQCCTYKDALVWIYPQSGLLFWHEDFQADWRGDTMREWGGLIKHGGCMIITAKPLFGLHFLVCSWYAESSILPCTASGSWLPLQVWHPSSSLVDKDTPAWAEAPSRVGNDKH